MKIREPMLQKLATVDELLVQIPYSKITKTAAPDIQRIAKRFQARYGLDIDTDPESDYEGQLFYNGDLRSITGIVMDWDDPLELSVWPKYWACNTDFKGKFYLDDDYFGNQFRKLVRDSSRVRYTTNGLITLEVR